MMVASHAVHHCCDHIMLNTFASLLYAVMQSAASEARETAAVTAAAAAAAPILGPSYMKI